MESSLVWSLRDIFLNITRYHEISVDIRGYLQILASDIL
jgi:hypothetical protein